MGLEIYIFDILERIGAMASERASRINEVDEDRLIFIWLDGTDTEDELHLIETD